MLSILIYAIVIIILLVIYNCTKPPRYPPGPLWLPLIGCIPQIQKFKSKTGFYYKAFEELSKIYGNVMGLKLGKQRFVVISSHDLVKKALLNEDFNGRPDGFFFRVRSFGKDLGVLFTEGAIWSQHRKFTLRHLKSFGLGQTIMTSQITMEAQCLVDYLHDQSKNGPVMMHTAFDIAVLNALWVMFAGHRFEYKDEKVTRILKVVHDVFRASDSLGGIISHMPFLRFIIPELSGYNDLMSSLKKLWSFLDDEISNHEANLSKEHPRDLIDAFLMEIASREANHREETIFDRENLLILCLDLFLAGSKTTTDTLATIFAYLALHPQWIKSLQEEMEVVIGRKEPPQLTDAPFLPKVEAFLAEAQRLLILAPLGVPHKTIKDTSFNGYRIPKDTIVLMNYYSVQNDPNQWYKPEEFNPDRFLDENGQFRQHNEAMPFGAGKRRCLGEIIARSSLFLYFTYVLHYFDIEISQDYGSPDMNGYDGFTISPKPYYLKLTLRGDLKV